MLSNFANRTLEYSEKHGLIRSGERIGLAVSGGADSTALAGVLLELAEPLGCCYVALHLNHGLRGDESDGDEIFARELSESWNLPFITQRVDAAAFSSEHGFSLEEGCRILRDRFFRETSAAENLAKIALGHNKDDQAETVLLHLFRGAARRGLQGMRPFREPIYIRPLLWASRDEILDYLKLKNLSHREDSSNQDIRFLRNRIRHHLLPLLERDYVRGLRKILAREADILREEEEYLEKVVDESLTAITRERTRRKIVLDYHRFWAYHDTIKRRIVRRILEYLIPDTDNISFQGLERIVGVLNTGADGMDTPFDGVQVEKLGGEIIFYCPAGVPLDIDLNVPGETTLGRDSGLIVASLLDRKPKSGRIAGDPETALFDGFLLKEEKDCLRVTFPREGDRFRPFGRGGTRKLFSVLAEGNIPRVLRKETPVLRGVGGRILWVVGVKRSAYYPIGPNTGSVIKLVHIPG